MTEKDTRYYWGDLRLWKTGLWHSYSGDPLGGLFEFGGVDQDDATVVPWSRGWKKTLDVACFFDPYPDGGWPSRAYHTANSEDFVSALMTRSRSLYPVFYIDDANATGCRNVVQSTLVNVHTTVAAAHGLVVGDRIVIRRDGVGLFSYGTIVDTPAADKVTMSTSHTVLAGDEILRLDSYYTGMGLVDVPALKPEADGYYYAKEVVYNFVGGTVARYNRRTVSRDA